MIGRCLMVLLAGALSAAGCVTFSVPAPQIREYRLDYTAPEVQGTPLAVVLQMVPFHVATVYGGQGVVFRQNGHELGVDPYNRWIADPGGMVSDLLRRDFADSNLYRAVQQGPSLLRSDYALSGEVEEIEEQIAGGCHAHVKLRVLLLRQRVGSGDPVVFQQTYTQDQPCDNDDAADVVAAMSHALRQISECLQGDVYEAIAADLESNED